MIETEISSDWFGGKNFFRHL